MTVYGDKTGELQWKHYTMTIEFVTLAIKKKHHLHMHHAA